MDKQPWKHNAAFTEDRLITIASYLAQVRGEVIDLHDDVNLGDTPLSLGVRAYECCRMRLIRKNEEAQWPWFKIITAEHRFTFAIDEVPVRFVRNDPASLPQQKLIRSAEAVKQLALFSDSIPDPTTRWFFVFDTYYKNAADSVFFVGYTESGAITCQWEIPIDPKATVLSSIDEMLPEAVHVGSAPVKIKVRIDKREQSE